MAILVKNYIQFIKLLLMLHIMHLLFHDWGCTIQKSLRKSFFTFCLCNIKEKEHMKIQ